MITYQFLLRRRSDFSLLDGVPDVEDYISKYLGYSVNILVSMTHIQPDEASLPETFFSNNPKNKQRRIVSMVAREVQPDHAPILPPGKGDIVQCLTASPSPKRVTNAIGRRIGPVSLGFLW